ncbi:unnamed protein product [Boreogadus saida]
MNRDMEKKRIVLRELSCRTSELPTPELPDCSPAAVEAFRPQSGSSGGLGGSPAAQLREYNPFLLHVSSSRLPFGGSSGGVSSAPEKGIVLPELSCRASAEFPALELLVRWSTES